MRWTTKFRLRLRSLVRSSLVERELDEELRYHLEHLVEDYVAAGMSIEDARRRARREMGAIEQNKEECRDARGVSLIDGISRDVVYALRALRKSPGFSTVAILSLALGIGANTAIFSLWNGVLLSSLPGVDRTEQLVMLTNPNKTGSWSGRWEGGTDGPRSWLTYEEFEQLRDHARSFSGVMASESSLPTWQVRFQNAAWEEARGRLVSGEFFDVLAVDAAIGRVFTVADDRAGEPLAVISHSYWQRRFGGNRDVLGRTFTIRNTALTIVGVTPAGFIGETSGQQPDFWLPLRLQLRVLPDKDRLHDTPPEKVMWLHVFGRMKPGVTIAQAESEANAIFHAGLESFYGAAAAARPEFLDQQLRLWPAARGASPTREEFSQSLTALLAAVVVLLLIASANLANLLLARGAARRSEIALRLSLGATRGRLVRQLVTESLVLASIGGAAAIAVAYGLHGALVRMLAESDQRFHMTFAVDTVILTFAAAATLLAALLFGLLPAWQVTRTRAAETLREYRGAVGSPGPARSARFLVSVQLALSLPLLVGAGLLAQTVNNLQRADLGFATERLLLTRVDLGEAIEDTERQQSVRREMLDALARLPGVRAVSFSHLGVFTGGNSGATIEVEGYIPRGANDRGSGYDIVGPQYFSTLGVPILLGREIQDSDRAGAVNVCVINEAFAKRFFDRRNPIGMHITEVGDVSRQTTWQVVGVVKNARTQALRGDVEPRYFVAAEQPPPADDSPTFLIRTATDAGAMLPSVRETLQQVNAAVPIMSARTIEQRMAPLTAQDRTTARLAIVFGAIALTLAAIGLYGVLAYGIARRTGEIAIRIALGAQSGRVVFMILRETVALVFFGLILGGGVAFGGSRLIGSRLYGVAAQDPLTLMLATGLLLVVAFASAFLPARKASKLDPVAALRLA
jgi:putative ABC transport system permease protein